MKRLFGNEYKKGFLLPSVLSFILISSAIILYETISLVSMIYAVEAQTQNLIKLEYIVNTKRIMSERDIKDQCRYEQLLSYDINGHNLQISANCAYTKTEMASYNEFINLLLTSDQISTPNVQIVNAFKNCEYTINDDQIEGKCGDDQLTSLYETQLTIYYVVSDDVSKIIISDETKIVRNINVKKK